jgi:hypothetical protein
MTARGPLRLYDMEFAFPWSVAPATQVPEPPEAGDARGPRDRRTVSFELFLEQFRRRMTFGETDELDQAELMSGAAQQA